MGKYRNWRWRNWGFANKLLIVYIPLIVFPSLIGLVILTNSYNQVSKEEITQNLKVIIDLTADKIDSQIATYDNITLKLITTPEISELLSRRPENKFEMLQIQRRLESYVKPTIGELDTEGIISCIFVTEFGRYVVGKDSPRLFYDHGKNFNEMIKAEKGAPVWFNPERFTVDNSEIEAFRVGRTLKNYAFQPIGIVYLVINAQWLENTLTNQVDPAVHLEVVNSRGQHVSGEQRLLTESDQITSVKTKHNNWSIIAAYSFNELYKTVNKMSHMATGVILFCGIIGLIATYLLVIDLVIPVKKLRINMKKGIRGVSPEKMSRIKGAKEISELNDLFISVMYEIYKLVENGKNNEKLKRQIEIKLLQKQLSPHFLYNTLNSIRWMAMIKKQNQIKEIVDALTGLLSYSIRDTDELVLLEDELSMLQEYVKIQKVRYQDFTFTVHKERDVEGVKILKFLLQPLIENALIHGFPDYEGFGKMDLSIYIEDDILYIDVSDNGKGISPDRLLYIQRILAGKSAEKHIGLLSIQERIQASYGSSYGLRVSSEEGRGATMELRLPIIRNQEVKMDEESNDC